MIRIVPAPRNTSFKIVFQIPHQTFNVRFSQGSMFVVVKGSELEFIKVIPSFDILVINANPNGRLVEFVATIDVDRGSRGKDRLFQ